MITYLNIIILYYINKTILKTPTLSNNQCINLFIFKCKFYFNWFGLINYNSKAITIIKQIHSSSYNTIYFKYIYTKNR